jgi:hypothetical protein
MTAPEKIVQPWKAHWPPAKNFSGPLDRPLDDGESGTTGAMPMNTITARGVRLWRLDGKEVLQAMLKK